MDSSMTSLEELKKQGLCYSATNPAKTSEYLVELSVEDVFEIQEGLASFKSMTVLRNYRIKSTDQKVALGLNGDMVSRENFPLPTVASKLAEASRNLHHVNGHGRGFCVIRGLDPKNYSAEDNVILYLAIANHVGGEIRGVQDRRGNVLVHVTDKKEWKTPYADRYGIHTNAKMTWHTDMGADILALHVRQCAKKGGNTYVASAWTVVLELVKNNPQVLETLLKPTWPLQTSSNDFVFAPLIQLHAGKLMICLDPGRLGRMEPRAKNARPRGSFDVASTVPDLTCMQRGALATVSKIAEANAVCLDSRPGDMIFIQNWATLHARDAYEDGQQGRHLVRMWLRSEEHGWDVPADMATPWNAAYGGGTGIIRGQTRNGWRRTIEKRYPIVPGPDYVLPRYSAGSAAYVIEDSDEDWEAEGSAV